MKENEAPEKIYISNFDIEALPKNEQLSERWHEVITKDTDIEYTRTDVFIEKAQLYLIDKLKEIPMGKGKMKIKSDCSLEDFIEDFENYMKGE